MIEKRDDDDDDHDDDDVDKTSVRCWDGSGVGWVELDWVAYEMGRTGPVRCKVRWARVGRAGLGCL